MIRCGISRAWRRFSTGSSGQFVLNITLKASTSICRSNVAPEVKPVVGRKLQLFTVVVVEAHYTYPSRASALNDTITVRFGPLTH